MGGRGMEGREGEGEGEGKGEDRGRRGGTRGRERKGKGERPPTKISGPPPKKSWLRS